MRAKAQSSAVVRLAAPARPFVSAGSESRKRQFDAEKGLATRRVGVIIRITHEVRHSAGVPYSFGAWSSSRKPGPHELSMPTGRRQ